MKAPRPKTKRISANHLEQACIRSIRLHAKTVTEHMVDVIELCHRMLREEDPLLMEGRIIEAMPQLLSAVQGAMPHMEWLLQAMPAEQQKETTP